MATAASALMRIDTNTGAKIKLKTRVRTWNPVGKKNYYHSIVWEVDDDCPAGFLAQKIKRDIKYQIGRLNAPLAGRTAYTWTWLPEIKEEAEYWEIWEVVSFPLVKRAAIYPALTTTPDQYATSWGRRTRSQLSGETADTYKRPPAEPENVTYWSHDVFEECNPTTHPVKGTFKIKALVYFLQAGNRTADAWVDNYLVSAQRDMHFGKHNSYTGGPLWQNDGRLAEPASGKIMTRYEAGEFYTVEAKHLAAGGKTITSPPQVQSYWKERAYPLHFWE